MAVLMILLTRASVLAIESENPPATAEATLSIASRIGFQIAASSS